MDTERPLPISLEQAPGDISAMEAAMQTTRIPVPSLSAEEIASAHKEELQVKEVPVPAPLDQISLEQGHAEISAMEAAMQITGIPVPSLSAEEIASAEKEELEAEKELPVPAPLDQILLEQGHAEISAMEAAMQITGIPVPSLSAEEIASAEKEELEAEKELHVPAPLDQLGSMCAGSMSGSSIQGAGGIEAPMPTLLGAIDGASTPIPEGTIAAEQELKGKKSRKK